MYVTPYRVTAHMNNFSSGMTMIGLTLPLVAITAHLWLIVRNVTLPIGGYLSYPATGSLLASIENCGFSLSSKRREQKSCGAAGSKFRAKGRSTADSGSADSTAASTAVISKLWIISVVDLDLRRFGLINFNF